MEGIKMETQTTQAINSSTTGTGNYQNPTGIVQNQNSTILLENQQLQSNYAVASSQKIKNLRLYPSRIHDADIYKEGPSYFAANYEAATETEWYFFSPREKKYLKGNRPNRAAGKGYWKATGADKSILSSKYNVEIGVVKTLVYNRGTPKDYSKTCWIMKEYRIKNSPSSSNYSSSNNSMKLDDYVLCKIYEHKPKKLNDTNVEGGGEANDQVKPAEDFYDDGFAQQLNIHQDHEPDHICNFATQDHVNQQNYMDHINIREIDNSAGQQLQQQQRWTVPNSNYSACNDSMFPNDMPMLAHPMHGNVFYPQNGNLMLHGTLHDDQQTVSGHGTFYSYNIPQEFPHDILPGADAAFNNVQALNNEPNISEGFFQAIPPLAADAFNNVQALINEPNISEGFSQAIPPLAADASNNVQAFNNEINLPQMQQQRYQDRLVMTRPPSSSSYHPYHHPDHARSQKLYYNLSDLLDE